MLSFDTVSTRIMNDWLEEDESKHPGKDLGKCVETYYTLKHCEVPDPYMTEGGSTLWGKHLPFSICHALNSAFG